MGVPNRSLLVRRSTQRLQASRTNDHHIAGSLSIVPPPTHRETNPWRYQVVYFPPTPIRRAHTRIRRRCRPRTHQENEEHQRTRRPWSCRSPSGARAPRVVHLRSDMSSRAVLLFSSTGMTILTSVISTPFASLPPFATVPMPP